MCSSDLEFIARAMLKSFRQDPAFHRLLMYARLEGHLLAGLFHERFGLPVHDFLKRYIVLRQEEGSFRPYDPQMAVMLTLGGMIHFAMGRHVFHAKRPPVSEESAIAELVEFTLAGLTLPAGARPNQIRQEKEKELGHAKK